jgi:hypothetical protein
MSNSMKYYVGNWQNNALSEWNIWVTDLVADNLFAQMFLFMTE